MSQGQGNGVPSRGGRPRRATDASKRTPASRDASARAADDRADAARAALAQRGERAAASPSAERSAAAARLADRRAAAAAAAPGDGSTPAPAHDAADRLRSLPTAGGEAPAAPVEPAAPQRDVFTAAPEPRERSRRLPSALAPIIALASGRSAQPRGSAALAIEPELELVDSEPAELVAAPPPARPLLEPVPPQPVPPQPVPPVTLQPVSAPPAAVPPALPERTFAGTAPGAPFPGSASVGTPLVEPAAPDRVEPAAPVLTEPAAPAHVEPPAPARIELASAAPTEPATPALVEPAPAASAGPVVPARIELAPTAPTEPAAPASVEPAIRALVEPAPPARVERIPATFPTTGPDTNGVARERRRRLVRVARPAPAAAAPEVLEIAGLVKRFGDTLAVDGLDLVVRAGSFTGIVGPNGAGKTTTLSMIAGLLRPDGGSVHINGVDAWKDSRAAKRVTGVLPDRLRTFDRLTGAQLLYSTGVLRGLDRATARRRADDLTAAFGLDEAIDRLVSDYSAGMTKKVALASAMIHSPRLLVLDEPFEGVDPVSAATMTEVLTRYAVAGGTVLLSSHSMDLIERVCDSAVVIVGGRVLASGTLDEVRDGVPLEERFVELAGGAQAAEGMEWLHSFSD